MTWLFIINKNTKSNTIKNQVFDSMNISKTIDMIVINILKILLISLLLGAISEITRRNNMKDYVCIQTEKWQTPLPLYLKSKVPDWFIVKTEETSVDDLVLLKKRKQREF